MSSSQTLDFVFENHYRPIKLRGKSKNTLRLYAITLNGFSQFLERPATLDDLTDDVASRYLDWLARTKTRARRLRTPQTINQRRAKLCAFWRWCARKQMVQQWPDIEALPEPRRIPLAYQLPAVSKLYDTLRSQPGTISGVPAGLWWESLYRTAYSTGERTSALLGSRVENLDLQAGTLFVPAEIRKGGRKSMLYHLLPDALRLLRQMASYPRDLIWPWTLSSYAFYYRTKRIHTTSGIGVGGIQRMRRTFASYLKANGGNPTEALGHSSSSVTEKSYLDPRVIHKEPENRKLPKID